MGTTPTTYTYGYSTGSWGDLLTSFNGASITYDAIGNPLTYYDGTSFGWTGRRLTSASKDGISYTFTYDDGGEYEGYYDSAIIYFAITRY